ncbi:methylmalonyl-CoA mutase subunit beta [Tenacibaculum geojense]|uniref:Methylmalonyl-CoA mutase subunit beta n=1 Tax=Tenacibaculum geojense TaxID=915352 RepID=A0ABW3JUV8_9FLAO
MSNYLFDEFEKISAKQWKQKIQVDLKGADYNETLLSTTNDGITIKPFYTKEDRTNTTIKLPNKSYATCESIFIDDEIVANKLAVDALQRGANAIEFKAESSFNIEIILANIDISKNTIYFKLSFLDDSFINQIHKLCNSENVFYNVDIIGNLASTGNWFYNLNKDHDLLKNIAKTTPNSLSINANIYQNAGANIPQQLAYTLAHANEYLNYFGEDIASKIHFNFAVGSNYFFEIAKLRAFRVLWQALLNEYKISNATPHIVAQPSLRNKTLYDYNVNMLRTTSECMSAILGGANTVLNISYDEIFHKSNEFGERISRNQLLILQEESEMVNAHTIANGTYYIEALTDQLSEKALEIFKLIEQGGGFLKQLKEGIIQRKISESATKEQEQFDASELVLLGTNKIQNQNDTMKNDLELFPFVKPRAEKTLIQPIIQKRLAEKLEQQRLGHE